MFTKEDVKQLIESVNVGTLTEDEKGVLTDDVYKRLNEAFEKCKEDTRKECQKEAADKLKKERVKSFKHGETSANEKTSEAIKIAEATAFEAGREQGVKESEANEEEVSEELIAKIEELCKEFDISSKLVELATHESSKEYFKESTKQAVSDFIEKKINESFPQKMVVNYDRLNKLEEVFESLKSTLTVNDESVCEARIAAQEAVQNELDEAKEGLQVQTKKRIAAEQMLESVKAENYLLKKISALPQNEQKEMLESFQGASIATIDESFDKEYQKVLRRHENGKRPVVNDVISESVVGKTLANEANGENRATMTNTITVNESKAKNGQKVSAPTLMDAYVSRCRHGKF